MKKQTSKFHNMKYVSTCPFHEITWDIFSLKTTANIVGWVKRIEMFSWLSQEQSLIMLLQIVEQ